MLPIPRLDDRSYDEIRDDAIKNIIKHCPEWTNHNASDPGVTLIELFSSMSEMILYRLNRVPDKNYLAFLDMIGVSQKLPSPAQTRIKFNLSEGYQAGFEHKNTVLIPKGTKISTDPVGEERPIVFETDKNLKTSNVKIANIYSKTFNPIRQKAVVIDNIETFNEGLGFIPFDEDSATANSTIIYLASEHLKILTENSNTTILFRLPTSMKMFKIPDNFLKKMTWEFFDGEQFTELKVLHEAKLRIDQRDADVLAVTLAGENTSFKDSVFEDISSEPNFYIRGILRESPKWLGEFAAYEVSLLAESASDGVFPDSCYHNLEKLEFNSEFYPFGERPKVDNNLLDEIFYIKCDEAFSRVGSEVIINLIQSKNINYIFPKGFDNLNISWEYSIGKGKWEKLEGEDSTSYFTKDGNLIFRVPKNMDKNEINAEEGYWVRAKINSGNFGLDEIIALDEESGAINTTPSTLNPPILSSVLVNYTLPRKDLDSCYTYNNFKYKKVVFDNNRPVEFFDLKSDTEEAIYFGFDSYISDDYLDLFFKIKENMVDSINMNAQQRLIKWEILKDGSWEKITIVFDETENLTKSGDIQMRLPYQEQLESFSVYANEVERMWIRAKVEFNSLKSSPKIEDILTNTTSATQKNSFTDEFLGKSTGLPSMRFKLNHTNLIKSPEIEVYDEEYRAIDRFIDYGKDDGVFRFNGITGEVEFGDGEYGKIPDYKSNIYVKEYSVTEGKKGNLSPNKLTILKKSINYIESVTNITPAIGGSDGDTLDTLKKRAPSIFKTMDRAVTIQDYEILAKEFSAFVERVKCISQEGEIILIVLTKNILDKDSFVNRKFLDDLQEFLESKSLITVKPIVKVPRVVEAETIISLKLTMEDKEFSRVELENALNEEATKYFNPFSGLNGSGYPIGKSVTKADFYKILNKVDSNFYFDQLKIKRVDSEGFVEKLILNYDEIVKFSKLKIDDITYDV